MKVDPRHLVQLSAIIEKKSFTLAAEALGTTQPALSRTIRLLEARVGAKLLSRDKGDLRPTDIGARLAAHGEIIAIENARAGLLADHVALGIEGEIRIGAPPVISDFLLPPLLSSFARAGSNLHYRIVEDTMYPLIERLAAGDLDFLVASTTLIERRFHFTIDILVEDRLVLVCRAGHPLLQSSLDTQNLASAQWILPIKGTGIRALSEAALMDVGLQDVDLVYEVNTPGLIFGLVRESDCIALLPYAPLRAQIEDGALARLDFEHPALSHRIGLVHRGLDRLSLIQRRFRDHALQIY